MVKTRNLFNHVTSRLRQALSQHKLLPPTNRVLVALSGGQDSLTLSESLHHLHKKRQWKQLSLAHCDHKWPEDEGNADLVRKYATNVQLPLHIIDAGYIGAVGSSENAAREWRYGELSRLAQYEGYDAVVTAHTRTDLAETVLYNLSHGAGADGLAALTWNRQLCDGVMLVRPFLDVSREDTELFCQQRGLNVWHDKYNLDRKYARNRIRAEVMPKLVQCVNPQVEEALAKTAHLLRDEAIHMEREARAIFHKVVLYKKKGTDEIGLDFENSLEERGVLIVDLDRKELAKLSIALQRRVVRRVLREFIGLSYDGATFAQVEAVRSLIDSDVNSSVASLYGNTCASVETDGIISIRQGKGHQNRCLVQAMQSDSGGGGGIDGSTQDLKC